MYRQVYMYSCACSLSSNPVDLYTVITCECSQFFGMTALLWASSCGQAETVRVLVELGASVEAVDKVHIHAHALVYLYIRTHTNTLPQDALKPHTHARARAHTHTHTHKYICIAQLHLASYIYMHTYMFIRVDIHFFILCIHR
jgi:hypothetical protein